MSSERVVVREIAGFTLVRELGEGGMGKVFLARQVSLDRLVAIKVLQPKLADDAEFLARFHREARAAALFQHPNVAAVIDAGTDPRSGVHYIAFEFVEGGSLEDKLRKQRILSEEEALTITRGVAQALAFGDSKGIVHRDVKPDNILLELDGTPKLADLGLAKEINEDAASLTQTGVVMGTPLYMAPEQALSETIDIRADIYSLGLCLWRAVTGMIPYEEGTGASSLAILTMHINDDLVDPRERGATVSEHTATLICSMTAREPSDRYRRATDVVRDIDRILVGLEPDGVAPLPDTVKDMDAEEFRRARASERLKAQAAKRASSGRHHVPAPVTVPAARSIPVPLLVGVLAGALVVGVGLAVFLSSSRRGADAEVSEAPPVEPVVTDVLAPVDELPVEAPSPPAAVVQPPPQRSVEHELPVDEPVDEPRVLDEPAVEEPLVDEPQDAASQSALTPREVEDRVEVFVAVVKKFWETLLRDVDQAALELASLKRAVSPDELPPAEAQSLERFYGTAEALIVMLRADEKAERDQARASLNRLAGDETRLPSPRIHAAYLWFLTRVADFGKFSATFHSLVTSGESGPERMWALFAQAMPVFGQPTVVECRRVFRRSARLGYDGAEDSIRSGNALTLCVLAIWQAQAVDSWPELPPEDRGAVSRLVGKHREALSKTAVGCSARDELGELNAVTDHLLADDDGSVVGALMRVRMSRTAPSDYLRTRLRALNEGASVVDGARGVVVRLAGKIKTTSKTRWLRVAVGDDLEVKLSRKKIEVAGQTFKVPKGAWGKRPALLVEVHGSHLYVRLWDLKARTYDSFDVRVDGIADSVRFVVEVGRGVALEGIRAAPRLASADMRRRR